MRSALRPLGPAARRPITARPGDAHRPLAAWFTRRPAESPVADPLARDDKLARLEAALFVADEPLPAKKLAAVAGLPDAGEVRRLIGRLGELLTADGSAFEVGELAGGYQLLTRAAFHPWLLRLRRSGHDLRLTPTALETLAVIAYKQPVTRAEVEAVRGVACSETIRGLMERGLVRVAGRHDSLGRPQLYGTTSRFLQAFGLNALTELPEADGLKPPV
jgi:segregation and condensation protein B